MDEGTREAAVSSVVGTVLLLGITVAVFAGVSVVVLGAFDDADTAPRSELGVVRGEAAYLLRHQGGDPVPLGRAVLSVGVEGGTRFEVPLTDLAADTADGASWKLGESLCVSCLYPGQNITGVFLVVDGALVLSEGSVEGVPGAPGGGPGGGPGNGSVELDVDAPAADPADPVGGETVRLSARVTNAGTDAAAPVVLEVFVDGASVGTDAVASLAGGASATLGVDWTAAQGTHAVRFVVDPEDVVAETDESDNTAGLSLTVAAAPGGADPGFPYEDRDGDGRYTEGVDGPLDVSVVADGVHDAGGNGLVIPASVPPIQADQVEFKGDGVTIHTDLTATGDDLRVESAGDLRFHGTATTLANNRDMLLKADDAADLSSAIFQARGTLDVEAEGVDLAGATVELLLNNKDLTVEATEDDVVLDDAVVDARGHVKVEAGGAVSALRLELELLQNGKDFLVDAGGDVVLDDAVVDARGHLEWTSAGSVSFAGAELGLLQNGKHLEATADGDVDASGADVEARGHVTFEAGDDADLSGLVLRMLENGKDLTATAGGALTADGDTDLEVRGHVAFEAGTMDVSGMDAATLVNNKRVELRTTQGALTARGTTVTALGHVTLTGAAWVDARDAVLAAENDKDLRLEAEGGDVDVRDARLSAGNDLFLTVPNASDAVLVDGAHFQDDNDRADVEPDGAATGTPASGGVE